VAFCVVSHSPREPFKTANRPATAIPQGVPTLPNGSPARYEILVAAGYPQFSVSTMGRAVEFLADAGRRSLSVADVQKEIWRRHAPEVVRYAYIDPFERILPDTNNY
jgi:hypothetical protein